MSVTNFAPAKVSKKQVLQQSNSNVGVPHDKDDTFKVHVLKSKDEAACQETENQFTPTKEAAKKLKNIRLDVSSPKRCGATVQKATVNLLQLKHNDFNSDDSGEEDPNKRKKKMRPVVPNYVTNSDTGPCRKPRQSRQDPSLLSSQTPSKLAKVQPLSIARRNARERNRVKQVNEGFATLRGRIPDYISEAYNEEKGRKSAKKLSKVETLRMAVDYIRHLETLLDIRSTTKCDDDDDDDWIADVKTESQPWTTPNSSAEYPSPVDSRQQSSLSSSPTPTHQTQAPYYDQSLDQYHDRMFYEYDLNFLNNRRETFLEDGKRSQVYTVLTSAGLSDVENQCVDDFKYYESFSRIKRENDRGDEENDENMLVNERDNGQGGDNLLLPERESDPLKTKDGMKKMPKKTVLPSITESFNKGVPVFY